MNLVFEKLAQLLAAGEVWRLNIGADFFRVVSADWALKVRILKAGRILGEMDGWQAGDYLRGVDFDGIEIENGGTSQLVTVQIAGGGVGSDRVIGEVSVIDGSQAQSYSGNAFSLPIYCGKVAGQIPHVGIFNEPGSTKAIVISEIGVRTELAGGVTLRQHPATLSSIVPTGGVAKRVGMPNGVAKFSYQNSATTIGAGLNVLGIMLQANSSGRFELKEPIWLDPGYGLVGIGVLSSDLGVDFQFRQVEI